MRKVEALASMRVAPRIFRPYDRKVLGRFLFLSLAKGEHYGKKRDPLQDLFGRERNAAQLVQRARRYGKEARSPARPRDLQAHYG